MVGCASRSTTHIHARGSIQFIYLSGLCFPIRVMPNDQKESEGSSVPAEVGQTSSDDSGGNSAAVDQVFSMFKDFLEKKLEDKGKQIEQRSKLDKEVVQLKFKGNQKQFELNAELNAIFESIETESESIEPNLSQIKKLSQEGRRRIRKRQKLIKIADKIRDGWQVVAKYESDELASGSEDEKLLKKAVPYSLFIFLVYEPHPPPPPSRLLQLSSLLLSFRP